jgi:hypothetical protein
MQRILFWLAVRLIKRLGAELLEKIAADLGYHLMSEAKVEGLQAQQGETMLSGVGVRPVEPALEAPPALQAQLESLHRSGYWGKHTKGDE